MCAKSAAFSIIFSKKSPSLVHEMPFSLFCIIDRFRTLSTTQAGRLAQKDTFHRGKILLLHVDLLIKWPQHKKFGGERGGKLRRSVHPAIARTEDILYTRTLCWIVLAKLWERNLLCSFKGMKSLPYPMAKLCKYLLVKSHELSLPSVVLIASFSYTGEGFISCLEITKTARPCYTACKFWERAHLKTEENGGSSSFSSLIFWTQMSMWCSAALPAPTLGPGC